MTNSNWLPPFFHFEHQVLRPWLFRLFPTQLLTALYSLNRKRGLQWLAAYREKAVEAFYPVSLGPLTFRNDLGNAAGLDKDGALLEFNYLLGAGFGLVGTVLPQSHTGNLLQAYGQTFNPWLPLPASHASLNSLGLPHPGPAKVRENIQRFRERYPNIDFLIGVSVMGHPLQQGQEQLDQLMTCLESVAPYADFIEMNESCPNVSHSSEGIEARIQEALKQLSIPLFIKMADVGDPTLTVQFFTDLGVSGLVGLNTQKNYTQLAPLNSDRKHFQQYTRNFQGGVGGELIKEHSFQQIQSLQQERDRQNSSLQLIHVGGLRTPEDIQRSRQYTPLRQWYTGFMENLGTRNWSRLYVDVLK